MTGRSVKSQSGRTRRGRPGYDLDTLLDASVEVFTERGFDGASMEDLSKHLGITKSAIYHHVASKDELLGLALNRAHGQLEAVFAEAKALDVGPVERLQHLLRNTVEVVVRERPYVALLLRVRGNTEQERASMARRRVFDADLAAMVQEAADAGAIAPEVPPALAARLLFGLVNSLTEWVRPNSDPEVVADAISRLVFEGLLVDGYEPPAEPTAQ